MAATAAEGVLLLAVVATMATLLWSTPVGAVQPPVDAPQNNYKEFIRRSCSSTMYPSLCYASLASYATAVDQDPTLLARVAANVSLSRLTSVASHVSSLCRAASTARMVDARTASALKDCEESLADAADLTRQAAAELVLLATAEGSDVAWRVSNAQTWMSAALTDEETCTDGFAAVAPGTVAAVAGGVGATPGWAVKANVCRRVRRAKQYTSNALALVNSLVAAKR